MNLQPSPLEEALRRLPRGPEFRFVDRMISLAPGKEGVGEYRVRGDEPFLRGHFPGEPLFPGVLLIEAATQVAGVVAPSDPSLTPLAGRKLTAVRSVKILSPVRPGSVIRLRAEITGSLGSLVHSTVAADTCGVTVMQAEIVLSGE